MTLYLITALTAFAVTFAALPVIRRTLGGLFLDPPGGIKKHAFTVPALGGIAVAAGFFASLLLVRFSSDFPTGTLHSLRGIFIGGVLVFAVGVWDDLNKPRGVSAGIKLAVQALAVYALVHYGVQINLFNSPQLSYPLTFLWVVGITNAFNLLDISDGLCVSTAVICALGLAVIALPSEFIYVNFAALALCGACLGFWPYNHSVRFKTFLGDGGSLFLGFTIAALAMGTGYSEKSNLGFLAPLLILAVPLFDTTFVFGARLLQKKNPLQGSDDHAALRLHRAGHSKKLVLLLFILAGVLCNALAYAVTQTGAHAAAALYLLAACGFAALSIYLWKAGGPHARA